MQIQNIFPTGQYGDNGRTFMVKDGANPWVTVATLSGTTWALTTIGETLRDSIVGSDITDLTLEATDIADGVVTLAKMADLAQDLFIGRTTASTGVPQTATITAAARTVLDDTTVAAMVDTLGGAATTGTGGIARATSPTFVTPALGIPASGTLTNCTGLTTAGIVDAAVTQALVKTKAVVALADANATLTAAQLVDSGIFTITPTAGRALTTDTATAIVAALPRYQVGTWFEFTIVNLAAQVVTLTAGVGITLSGVATVNNVSGTWLARIDSASAITMYRE